MATVAKNTRSTTIVPVSDTAGPFSLTFRLFDTDAVKVYVDGKPVIGWSLSATFTNGYADAATITFPAPILSGSTIIIDAALVPWRADDLINGDLNIVSRLNNELGRIWATLGELRRDTDRSVRVFDPVDPVGDFDLLNVANAAEAAALAKSAADAAAASAAAASAFDPANFATSAQGTKADNAIPALAQAQVTDFNAVDTTRSGQYWAANTATNGPGVSEDFAVTYTRRDAASGHAMIISTQTGRLFVRRRRASVWGAWIEFPNSLAIIEAADANNATKSGFHRLQNTCANLPAAGTYECIVSAPNSTDIAQIAIRATDGASWRRTKTAGAWGAWVAMVDANNIDTYSKAIGVGQTWVNLQSSRQLGVSYQNTSGKPIMVSVTLNRGGTPPYQVSADNVTWNNVGHVGGNSEHSFSFIVPNNHYYRCNGGSGNATDWAELR